MNSFQVCGRIVQISEQKRSKLMIVRYGRQRQLDQSKKHEFINAAVIRIPNPIYEMAGVEFKEGEIIEVVGQLQGSIMRGSETRVVNELVATKIWNADWDENADASQPKSSAAAGKVNGSASAEVPASA